VTKTRFFFLILLIAAFIGCGGAQDDADLKPEIQAMLEAYLPNLGEAYRLRKPELLTQAVPKEQARIGQRISELAGAGQVIDPKFKSVTVESVSAWNHANAFVTTVEVWDVRSYSAGSLTLLKEQVDQRSRVKYQLKRDDGQTWTVLYRELAENLN
jgi:hypothetical protein